MLAWTVHKFGNYREQLKLEQAPLPPVTGSDALIKVKAMGVNFFDLLVIAGKYQVKEPLPFIAGAEAAGEVVETGDTCDLKVGERVMTRHAGAFAQYMLAPQAVTTIRLPLNMSYQDAAAFQFNYQTAYFALAHRAGLKQAEYLLVHGAAGGVGTAVIQLGKALGARVIAAAGSVEKLQICKQCGAEFLINCTSDDFVEKVMEFTAGKGADVIFDPVGGDVFDRSTRCIAWEGRIVVVGFTSGRIPAIRTNKMLLKNMSVIGLWWGNYRLHNPQLIAQTRQRLYQLYDEGAIKPVIHALIEFENLPRALELIESRQSYGKVVLRAE